MGNIVVSEFISLDGVIEDPGGAEDFEHGGWTFKFEQGEEGQRFKFQEVLDAESLLLGRVTYDHFAAAWPTMEGTGAFGERMNGMPKHVVSSTLTDTEWNNSHVLSGDMVEEVTRLREASGGDVLVSGSSVLVQGLVANDLVDELRLMVFPIVLGSGKRLFGDAPSPAILELADSRPVGPDGVVILTYRAKKA